MRALVIGAGYVGSVLATELADQGHEVFALRRRPAMKPELARPGVTRLSADISQPAELAKLPSRLDWIVNCAAPGSGEAEAYEATYLRGTANLIEYFRAAPPTKYVYTSSTAVYAQDDGSVVTETSPASSRTPTGRVLVETEEILKVAAREQGFPAVILRVAGIYGPGRGYWFRQFMSGQARMVGDGARFMNMIHRDDVAGTILAALSEGTPGQVYNAVDDEPVTQHDFFRWLSEQTGRAMPTAVEDGSTPRSRAATNKRVSNRKLKEQTGYAFRYPTFRQGYAGELVQHPVPGTSE
jgi:nucleoside-diphosphate-sugar epimerase